MINFLTDEENFKEVYEVLRQKAKESKEYQDSDQKELDKTIEALNALRPAQPFISTRKIQLPSPLEGIEFGINLRGNRYNGKAIIFYPHNFEDSFFKAGEKNRALIKGIEVSQGRKVEVSRGFYVADSKSNLLFYVGCNEPSFGIEISFGERGTLERRIGNFEQFETDMGRYIELATETINSAIKNCPDINYTLLFERVK